jgi:hypothetical protein
VRIKTSLNDAAINVVMRTRKNKNLVQFRINRVSLRSCQRYENKQYDLQYAHLGGRDES